ncbi:MAG: hypothetical protein WA061_02305 [Microgenomates group bacterium]
MGKRKTKKEIQSQIDLMHGVGKIKITKYTAVRNKGGFKCLVCGHRWTTFVANVIKRTGCPICATDGLRLSMDEVRKIVEDNGAELISKKYKNTKEHLKIKFTECGHVRKMSLYAIQQRQGCKCRAQDKFKETLSEKCSDKLNVILKEKNYVLLKREAIMNWDSFISYKCDIGHIVENQTYRDFSRRKKCKQCCQDSWGEKQRGCLGNNWKGGITFFRIHARKYLTQWKKDSMKESNYKCIITGDRFDDIHHLYSMDKILRDALYELGIDMREFVKDYSQEEIDAVSKKIVELHDSHPLGVCLRKDIHALFHSVYGYGNTDEVQFYEFKEKIKSGEIIIPEI